jgi:hypothetical protein
MTPYDIREIRAELTAAVLAWMLLTIGTALDVVGHLIESQWIMAAVGALVGLWFAWLAKDALRVRNTIPKG